MRGMLLMMVAVGALGCGSDYLDRDVVTSLPPGDASGSALSGSYSGTVTTTACAGTCMAKYGIFTYTFCEVGDVDKETFQVTQNDGVLEVTGASHLYVASLRGGVDADGRFDVGGYATESGGQIGIVMRVEGTIDGSGTVDAVAKGKGDGSADGVTVNCSASYRISGQRR